VKIHISGFDASPDNAEALVRWGGKVEVGK